jgi:GT2 family glycosyltransferase
MSAVRLTIGITTRNRPEALRCCLRSLQAAAHLAPEVLVFDDGSSPPAAEQLANVPLPLAARFLRDDAAPGNIVGRNRLMREASAPAILLLDDAAALLTGEPVECALRVFDADRTVAAVAFAQADGQGARWDEAMQPSHGRVPCYVPVFIGFAHLLRRDVFLSVGGYRESFVFYGEEKDLCLRLIDAGHRTVYLPDALVIHEPDQSGRSKQRYLRYVTRNDCLTALYNEPWGRLAWLLPRDWRCIFECVVRGEWTIRGAGPGSRGSWPLTPDQSGGSAVRSRGRPSRCGNGCARRRSRTSREAPADDRSLVRRREQPSGCARDGRAGARQMGRDRRSAGAPGG